MIITFGRNFRKGIRLLNKIFIENDFCLILNILCNNYTKLNTFAKTFIKMNLVILISEFHTFYFITGTKSAK